MNGSEYLACGMLSGLTGNRAHGIVLDDPVRGREQADSEVVRDKVFDAYEDDLKTRLVPGGWIVLIQTRWHEDDLAGRILPEAWQRESGAIACRDGNTWDVLCLQARCETDTDPLERAGRVPVGRVVRPQALVAVRIESAHLGVALSADAGAARGRSVQA
jgi:hypothetical protein